jgi:hypothetical protein
MVVNAVVLDVLDQSAQRLNVLRDVKVARIQRFKMPGVVGHS